MDEANLPLKSYLTRIYDQKSKCPEGYKRLRLKCVKSNFNEENVVEIYDYDPKKVTISTFSIEENEPFCLFPARYSDLAGFQEVQNSKGKSGYVLPSVNTLAFLEKPFNFLFILLSIVSSILIFFFFLKKGYIAYGKFYYLAGIIVALIVSIILIGILGLIIKIGKNLIKRI